MKRKMLIAGILLTLLITLNSCYNDDSPHTKSAAEVPVSSFSESKEKIVTEEPSEKAESEPTEITTPEGTECSKDISETKTTTVPVAKDIPKSNGAEKEKQTEIPQKPAKEQNTEQTAPPKESEPETTKPKPTSPPEPEKPAQPEFDINHWTTFAKQYAESIGLTLDSTATACWDNPISANPGNKNIEADITSRLNRYKNSEGFTAVWVWAEKVSGTEYEIYIGYA